MKLALPVLSNLRNHSSVFLLTFLLAAFVFHPLHAQVTAEKDSSATESLSQNNLAGLQNNTPWRNAGIIKNDPKYSQPYQTIEQLFAGRVAGVQVMETSGMPGGEFSVRVRGVGELMGTAEPLYVIDGFPLDFYNKDFGVRDHLDPNRRANMSNALSLINPSDIESVQVIKNASALASYGRRAANGVVIITTKKNNGTGLKIDFESSLSIQKMTRKVEMLSFEEYFNYRKKMSAYNPISYGSLHDYFQQLPSDAQTLDWMDEVSQTGKVQNNQLGISGNVKGLNFSIRGGLFNHNGIVKNTGFERKNILLNLGRNFWKDRIEIGASNYYAAASANLKSIRNVQEAVPLGPVYNSDGSFHSLMVGNQELENPLADLMKEGTDKRITRFISNNFFRMEIVKNLTLNTRFAFSSSKNDYDPFYLSGSNYMSTFLDVKDRLFDGSLSYSKPWKENILHITAGYASQAFLNNGKAVTGDKEGVAEWFRLMRGGGSSRPTTVSRYNEFSNNSRLKSVFIQSSLEIGAKKFVNVNYRRDYLPEPGSFAYDASNSLGIGASWILKDPVIQKNEVLSFLKLNLDLGYMQIANKVWLPYLIDHSNLQKGNKQSLGIGAEMGFVKNMINVKIDLFDQVNRNAGIPLETIIPLAQGYQKVTRLFPIDKMFSRGVDLSIEAKLISNEKFMWNMSANASLFANKIKNPSRLYGDPDNPMMKNRPIGSWYLLGNNGVWKSDEEISREYIGELANRPKAGDARYVDVNGDGKTDLWNDGLFRGKANPSLIWGWNSVLSWRKFDLFVLVRGEHGQKVNNINARESYGHFYLDNLSRSAAGKAWSPDNTIANFPATARLESSNIAGDSDWFLQKGAFVRLQNLSLGYTIPMFTNTSARLYLSGQNLLLLTKYEGWDPEVNANGQHAIMRGTDSGVYPRARTFTAGVQVHL